MQQAKILIKVRPEPYINDVTNVNLIDNEASPFSSTVAVLPKMIIF